MFFVGTDMFEDSTLTANIKSDGAGRVLAKVYATSGMVTRTAYHIDLAYTTNTGAGLSWFQPRDVGSTIGLVGISSGAIASGCVGWVTIRGQVTATASATVEFTGSIGHAVFFTTASGVGASSSAYLGLTHQIGFLMEEATATLSCDIFLTGNTYATGM